VFKKSILLKISLTKLSLFQQPFSQPSLQTKSFLKSLQILKLEKLQQSKEKPFSLWTPRRILRATLSEM